MPPFCPSPVTVLQGFALVTVTVTVTVDGFSPGVSREVSRDLRRDVGMLRE